jgi:hypothetical protein
VGKQQGGRVRSNTKEKGPLTFGRWFAGAVIASALGASILVGYLYDHNKPHVQQYVTAHHLSLSGVLAGAWGGFALLFFALAMIAAVITPSFGRSKGGNQTSSGWGAWGN